MCGRLVRQRFYAFDVDGATANDEGHRDHDGGHFIFISAVKLLRFLLHRLGLAYRDVLLYYVMTIVYAS